MTAVYAEIIVPRAQRGFTTLTVFIVYRNQDSGYAGEIEHHAMIGGIYSDRLPIRADSFYTFNLYERQ